MCNDYRSLTGASALFADFSEIKQAVEEVPSRATRVVIQFSAVQ
jgi:hypothetical protein